MHVLMHEPVGYVHTCAVRPEKVRASHTPSFSRGSDGPVTAPAAPEPQTHSPGARDGIGAGGGGGGRGFGGGVPEHVLWHDPAECMHTGSVRLEKVTGWHVPTCRPASNGPVG